MKISKTQLRMIVKEELDRVMILQEGKQYKKTHGRIDEGLIGDLAKKYGVQKRIVSAILAASIGAGAVAPKTAEAGKFFQKQGPDVEQQVETPWYQNMEKQDDGSLAAIKIYDIPGGQQKAIVFADSDGNPPTSQQSTPDGPQYIYGSGDSASVGEEECKSKYSGSLPENSPYNMICIVRAP
jgi:hypothetical protein